jgi:SAM-dependent methyltransferase
LAPYSSLVGKYSRALHKKNYKLAISKINEFNATVTRLQSTNEFIKHLKSKKTISRVFIHEILNEIYSRSVSPNINLLKKYAAFSSNVYGELLPKFLSQVFDQVGLNSKSKFLDLGSGVGNVTIQAALEYGCESYGCEVMQNCSELGDLQLTEFEQRCKIFGLNPGVCKFFHRQSFLDNPEVKSVIDQCDVILCNNFLFTPDLKEKTLKLFNNLKPGTKIISLKTILPDSHHIEFDDVENFINKFEVCKYEFETNSVSWTHKGGVFYITEFTGLISERALSVFNTRARERKLVIHKRLSD